MSGGIQIHNTCGIDSILTLLFLEYKSNDAICANVHELSNTDLVCETLLEVFRDAENGDWVAGRVKWMDKMVHKQPKVDRWFYILRLTKLVCMPQIGADAYTFQCDYGVKERGYKSLIIVSEWYPWLLWRWAGLHCHDSWAVNPVSISRCETNNLSFMFSTEEEGNIRARYSEDFAQVSIMFYNNPKQGLPLSHLLTVM